MNWETIRANWRRTARRALPFVVTAVGGFVLAYLIVAFFVFPPQLVSSDAEIPNVVGLSYDSASKQLEAAGFDPSKGPSRFHDSAPAGTVLGQDPPPGSTEARGTRVTLELSRGQRTVLVPPVAGMSRTEAELAIQNAGLAVGEVHEEENAAVRGQVLSSQPDAGARVPVPSPVDLTVSAGPSSVLVPDVAGQDVSQARAVLAQVGLTVGAIRVDSASILPPNTVVAQSPAAQTSVPLGTAVALTITPQRP
ncbi:MAG TPA: PASTA domain-containing protein [Gemmatimonadaceae bacterium]|nr:PASTA domain-containing protein [Gemmatimonadaceae bacterium]